jgi:hypothetical protein
MVELSPEDIVTIEGGAGQSLDVSVGKTGKVVKVVGAFAILDIGDRLVGCLTDYCQPKITQALLEARYGANSVT